MGSVLSVIFLAFPLNTFPLKQRLSGPELPTHKHRNGCWEILYLSSVRPRFSISLVTSAISSFSLWEQTGSEEVSDETEGRKQQTWCLCDVWPSRDALISPTAQCITLTVALCSSYISPTNTCRQTLFTEEVTQKEKPLKVQTWVALSPAHSFSQQPLSSENPLWEL